MGTNAERASFVTRIETVYKRKKRRINLRRLLVTTGSNKPEGNLETRVWGNAETKCMITGQKKKRV